MSHTFQKPALSIENQIAHLQQCGMHIYDFAKAQYWLKHVSYYRLSAYWHTFKTSQSGEKSQFRAGTNFDHIVRIYDFDRDLRRLVTRGCEHYEATLRGSWAYQMAMLGNGHSYLNPTYYSDSQNFENNKSKLESDVERSSEDYIVHYKNNYHAPHLPPSWMVAEMMSLGQLSRWFTSLKLRSI